MLIGRFLFLLPLLAAAGSLAAKKQVPVTQRHAADARPLFVGLLVGTVVIVGALTFFPALVARADRRAFPHAAGTTVLAGTAGSRGASMAVMTPVRRPPRGPRRDRTTTSLLPPKLRAVAAAVRSGDRVARAARVVRQAESGDAAQEPGDVRRRGRRRADDGVRGARHRHRRRRYRVRHADLRSGCGSRCCSRTSPRRWPRPAARRRPTRCARRRPKSSASRSVNDGKIEQVPGSQLRAGDIVLCEAGDIIPGDGEVIEGVASIDESVITGESAPVIRESGGDRSAVTGGTRVLSDWIKSQDHVESRRDVPRSDDRAGRRGAAAEDAERDRAEHPHRRAHADLPACRGYAAAVCGVQRRGRRGRSGAERRRAGRAARLPDSDDHRRPAVGDRHRRHGPRDAAQRAGDERQGGRGVGRRAHAAARQDRNHHARQPAGGRVRAAARGPGIGTGGRRPALEPRRRDTRRALHRRSRQREIPAARPRRRRQVGPFHPILRLHADERRRSRRPAASQRRGRHNHGVRQGTRRGRAHTNSQRHPNASPARAARRSRWQTAGGYSA